MILNIISNLISFYNFIILFFKRISDKLFILLKYFIEIKKRIDNSHNDVAVEFLLLFIVFTAHTASGTWWDLAGLPAIRLKITVIGAPLGIFGPAKKGRSTKQAYKRFCDTSVILPIIAEF